MKILMSSITIATIIFMMFIITTMISKKKKMSREKNTPFECGFSNMSSARKPFSTHFFLIATIFLIFDIEMSIILPMMNNKMVPLNEWLLSSTITIMILIVGLMHEWNNGMLEWSK
uniref:NADH-ubiquinone oxidoreductase chain 3 n=1 Tax=Metcalfa pruinosa TaxID=1185500 RepID=A0A8F2TCB1_9HEMI|nr:NADH dehydrogenase subunit 3 [Metcalfa pruinosa]QWV61025.1 NADH dehydrogenase subunit 3 [Metcalfa pruinosa]WAR47339.1 NADH dehydrogenase subunit 3 [Metcalfa pruinosa]